MSDETRDGAPSDPDANVRVVWGLVAVRIGAVLSVAMIGVASAGLHWNPGLAWRWALAMSVPYALALWLVRSAAREGSVRVGLDVTVLAAVAASFIAFLRWLGGGEAAVLAVTLGLFLVVQALLAGAALVAGRGYAGSAASDRTTSRRLALGGSCLVYFFLVADAAIPSFGHPRWEQNQRLAAGQIRDVMSAEAAYQSASGGFYGALECLAEPPQCLAGPRPEVGMIDSEIARTPRRWGYEFSFHGLPASEVESGEAPASTPSPERRARGALQRFAYLAVPIDRRDFPGWRRTGRLAFCGDDTGRVCFTEDGSAPPLEAARCSEPCREWR